MTAPRYPPAPGQANARPGRYHWRAGARRRPIAWPAGRYRLGSGFRQLGRHGRRGANGPADGCDFDECRQRMPPHREGGAGNVVPADRDLGRLSTKLAASGDQLDIEGEARGTQVVSRRPGDWPGKELQSALGICDAGRDPPRRRAEHGSACLPEHAVPVLDDGRWVRPRAQNQRQAAREAASWPRPPPTGRPPCLHRRSPRRARCSPAVRPGRRRPCLARCT